jgi:hypothetical protein
MQTEFDFELPLGYVDPGWKYPQAGGDAPGHGHG